MLAVTCAVSGMSWLSARGARWAPSASALANGVLVTLPALAAVAHVGPLSAVACVLPIIIYYLAAAVRGELEPRLRDAARALLAEHPWGSEVRARA